MTDEFQRLTQRAKTLRTTSRNPNTARGMAADRRYWEAWHRLVLQQPMTMPVSREVVLAFIADHEAMPAERAERLVMSGVTRVLKPAANTFLRRVRSLSMWHEDAGLPNPVDEEVATLLKAVASTLRPPAETKPIDEATLRQMLGVTLVRPDCPYGIRDRALLAFMFASGGRRRSEVAELKREDLVVTGYGFQATVRVKGGRELTVPVTELAAEYLNAWLVFAHITEGHVFRGIGRDGTFSERLSAHHIRTIVQQRFAALGRREPVTAHSIRHGYIHHAREVLKLDPAVICATTGQSMLTMLGYAKPELVTNPAVRGVLAVQP